MAAGSYTVEFTPCSAGNYVSEWYNDKLPPAAPDPVSVTDGETTTGIDATLADGATITGQVTDGTNPLQGACVSTSNPSIIDIQPSATTDANGNYTLQRLPAGSYKVHFSACGAGNYAPQYYDGKADADSADSVQVSAGGTTSNIDAALAPGATITGHVDGPSGPLNGVCVMVTSDSDSGFAFTNASGDYSISQLAPGPHTVRFLACGAGNFISEYYNDEPDAQSADPVNVSAGGTTPNINASLAPGGTISGHVEGPGGPLSNICIQVSTADGAPTAGGAVTDPSGNYTVQGLATGSYLVLFIPCMGTYSSEYFDDQQDLESATPLAVTAGQATSGIDATLEVDTTAPLTTITSGPGGTTNQTSAAFAFRSNEAFTYFECKLDGGDFEPCAPGQQYSGLSEGEHTFSVHAGDLAGHTGDDATRTWTIDADSESSNTEGEAPPGGTVSNDPAGNGPTPTTPVTTAVTTPSGGTVTISESSGATEPAPSGFSVFGHEIEITAPAATVADPLRLVFTLDDSLLPGGTDPNTVTVMRDGSPAGDCPGATQASPDPCVADRELLAGGDLQLTVLASHASSWNFLSAAQGSSQPGTGSNQLGNSAKPVGPPDTRILNKSIKRAAGKAKFYFDGSGGSGPVRFQCKIDQKAFSSCASPKLYRNLGPGKHTFRVRTKDAAGRIDPTPAKAKFRITES